jgi:hypothetical protein
MEPSTDLSEQIASELAAVEHKITQLLAKLRVLEARRDKLRTAQSVLLEFLELEDQGLDQSGQPSSASEEPLVQH